MGAVTLDLLNPDTRRVSWCKQRNICQYQSRNLNQRDHPTSLALADPLGRYLRHVSRPSMRDTIKLHWTYRYLIRHKFSKRS